MGYYDRALPGLTPGTPAVAVVFHDELVEALPIEPHDVPVTAVVTERIGGRLLEHAMHDAVKISELAGLQLVVVEAIDSEAAAYYGKHGLTRFRDASNLLFMPVSTIRASLEKFI